MANLEQVEILKRGVEVWDDWRKANPDAVIDLIRANLYRATLHGAVNAGVHGDIECGLTKTIEHIRRKGELAA